MRSMGSSVAIYLKYLHCLYQQILLNRLSYKYHSNYSCMSSSECIFTSLSSCICSCISTSISSCICSSIPVACVLLYINLVEFFARSKADEHFACSGTLSILSCIQISVAINTRASIISYFYDELRSRKRDSLPASLVLSRSVSVSFSFSLSHCIQLHNQY